MTSRVPVVTCAAAVVCIVAIVFTTHAHTLTETDSINLAKGLQHYSVATQSPHPPGYPLVVLTAHLFTWTGSVLNAYLTVAALAAVATVITTFLLGRELFDDKAGAIAVLAVVATPLFLYYSDIVSVYLTESAMVSVVALLAHRVARRADRLSPFFLFPALAVGAGFRPTMLFLMLPVCVVGIVLGRPRIRPLLAGVAVAIGVVLAWGIPMVSKSGGWHAYSQASSSLYDRQGKATSLLYGAPLHLAAFNVEVALAATTMVAVPAILIVALARRRRSAPETNDTGDAPRVRTAAWWILAAWFVPYAAIYFAVQLGKPGYVLAYLPLFAVAAGGLISPSPRALPIAAGVAVLSVAAFLLVPQWPLPWRLDAFAPTAHGVRVQDQEAEGLAAVGHECPASACVIVSLDDSKKFWYHDPASLVRWYSSGARIVPWASAASAGGIRAHDSVYWVGSVVPPEVSASATYVMSYGTWQVYRSSPGVTKEILTASNS
jgi:hypothetical protein